MVQNWLMHGRYDGLVSLVVPEIVVTILAIFCFLAIIEFVVSFGRPRMKTDSVDCEVGLLV